MNDAGFSGGAPSSCYGQRRRGLAFGSGSAVEMSETRSERRSHGGALEDNVVGIDSSSGDGAEQRAAEVDPARDVRAVVEKLESELRARKRRRWLRWGVALVLGLGAAVGFWVYRQKTAPPPAPRFTTAPVEVRDIREEVRSTGVVEPLHQVEVGAQVSGRVVAVHADYNERVEEGQLLAEIDPQLFGAEVVQFRAQLKSGKAALARAEATRAAARVRLERLTRLVEENAASEAELDQARADLEVAEAEVQSAQAQIAQVSARLKSASTTLSYTKIYSPIDGVVINRQIEPGQTVASSFNTPLLFLIARDMSKMRVLADIDEADVGKVEEGMSVQIEVDAFPGDEFEGELTQIRLSPNTVEGVVTYSAVIVVENEAGKLRPGMTAIATIVTDDAKQVSAVRNAALRFEPLPPSTKDGAAPGDRAEARAEKKLAPPEAGQARVYFEGSGPARDPGTKSQLIDIGISDGVWTEVEGGLEKGQEVIVDERPRNEEKGFRLF